MACSQRTFTLEELKGTYYEIQNSGELNPNCILIVGDSTVTLKNCSLLKDFTGHKIRIVGNRLLYYFPEYYTSFEISENGNSIQLYQPIEENEDITFKKVK